MWVVLANAFNPRIQETETFTAQSWKLAWCTVRVPGKPKLHSEILSLKKEGKKKKDRKKEKKRKNNKAKTEQTKENKQQQQNFREQKLSLKL